MKIAPKHSDALHIASDWSIRLGNMFKELFKPFPFKKHFGYDCASLIILTILQFQVIPLIFGRSGLINIFLPWIGLYVIRDDRFSRSFFLILLASILLETHSSTPMGVYFFSFLFFLSLIALSKHHFSWLNYKTWLFFMGVFIGITETVKWLTLVNISGGVAKQFIIPLITEGIVSFSLGVVLVLYTKFQSPDDSFQLGGQN